MAHVVTSNQLLSSLGYRAHISPPSSASSSPSSSTSSSASSSRRSSRPAAQSSGKQSTILGVAPVVGNYAAAAAGSASLSLPRGSSSGFVASARSCCPLTDRLHRRRGVSGSWAEHFAAFDGLRRRASSVNEGVGKRNQQLRWQTHGERKWWPFLAATRRSVIRASSFAQNGHGKAAGKTKEMGVEVVDMEDLLKERDACGVGVIANLKNKASHKIVEQALIALGCMEHRGACSADNRSGDGAGVMTRIPWALFNEWAKEKGLDPLDENNTGVGMVFLPRDLEKAAAAQEVVKRVLEAEGIELLGWREVPVTESVCGIFAKATLPTIRQVFVKMAGWDNVGDIERELFIARKKIEKAAKEEEWGSELYFCGLSSQTIVYKGMLMAAALGEFYQDLKNDLYASSFAIYHRRFSTNTNPKWPLAQPMRFLGHNGEINTLQGNLNWMRSRESVMTHPDWKGREDEFRPIGNASNSDSANLDSAAEVLLLSGKTPEETLMILVPEAYQNNPTLRQQYPEVIDFYEYYKGQMEAWDGPALLVFSNGKTVGACLDRNGLRPARFWRTSDDMLYVASEVGVLNIDDSTILSKGRLGPGMMVIANVETGEVLYNSDIKKRVASLAPYGDWLKSSRVHEPAPYPMSSTLDGNGLLTRQNAFGYSSEDVQLVIENMAAQGKEPTFCMGDDIPLAALSQRPHLLFDYFKQRFAQVTNPPIDPLREGLVMSLEMNLGERGNILNLGPENARQVRLPSPILNEQDLMELKADPELKPATLPIFFDISQGLEGALGKALEQLCADAENAVRNGSKLIVLSDQTPQLEASRPAIPVLLAVGAVHHHLIQRGVRLSASIVADTAQCFSTHHFACLIGYGASAICPYLALETCRQWRLSTKIENMMKRGRLTMLTVEQAQINFQKAISAGLLKILSKMGISLLSSYWGAQIFEIYGLGKEVVDTAFRGTVSRIGGLTMDELARETVSFWSKGLSPEGVKKLDNFGFIQFRPGGEHHGNNPEMAKLLHKAIREKNAEAYAYYQEYLANCPVHVLRDMLELKSDREPIPLDMVEPSVSIVERFCTGGMSLGAISRETHEAIAIAMNRIGGKSNSGEGGEDPIRWKHLDDVDKDGKSMTLPHLRGLVNGDTATSAIKQVASGRFGVTPTFLVNADQLEIKIAQGAKPGEGGQLPGTKVSPYIATLRKSKPGVPLISPPPHHDIYSIEDLAQLIYDLHMVNPSAKVSVKLVAEAGIGTVASGVAKANADTIQISGHDGGTGASPISSIKHAGGPWEMGLTETHQTLVANGLRDRVVVRVDGGMKSGRDVIMGAIMGADEYGFGSIAMIATGCIMARICHTNNCPVGVASQREELRARFPGAPGDLVNYFLYVAEEVRHALAQLGYSKMDDIIGKTHLFAPRLVDLEKSNSFDLSFILTEASETESTSSERRRQPVHTNGDVLDDELLADPESGGTGNTNNLNKVEFMGSAGQSFACFLMGGMKVKLIGEGNDYVCKGMAGGEVAVVPPEGVRYKAEEATIVGNTCLYGATGGRLFVRGMAGERFAVRNSLAEAVVEGAGDHCCEYMTGGCVVSLGKVGLNVAAGMTGGLGYFLDEDGTFPDKAEYGPSVGRTRSTNRSSSGDTENTAEASRGEEDEGTGKMSQDSDTDLEGDSDKGEEEWEEEESKEEPETLAQWIKHVHKLKWERHIECEICLAHHKHLRNLKQATAAEEKRQAAILEAQVEEKTGSNKGKEVLAKWSEMLPKFWQLVPPSEEETPEASVKYGDALEIPALVMPVKS
ncbi:hypothetical protein CBR_g38420 [Chara braunii]|uniref:glutamate synthase (ferredoxin) n=1 Tax=Chara braunii TaxID=69332 RepID=A0A388JNM5_CHABU|nr:hypothetical protein CBR_g38420 [Chara braunii]|eukprot:GBG59394.1 hypothetical protein CBR_g38420 [Chara braunii]